VKEDVALNLTECGVVEAIATAMALLRFGFRSKRKLHEPHTLPSKAHHH